MKKFVEQIIKIYRTYLFPHGIFSLFKTVNYIFSVQYLVVVVYIFTIDNFKVHDLCCMRDGLGIQ